MTGENVVRGGAIDPIDTDAMHHNFNIYLNLVLKVNLTSLFDDYHVLHSYKLTANVFETK